MKSLPFLCSFKLLNPLEVHRDGDIELDSTIVQLSDEDTAPENLFLKLTKAPKHGNVVEVVKNLTSEKPAHRKIGENEQFSAALLASGRLL